MDSGRENGSIIGESIKQFFIMIFLSKRYTRFFRVLKQSTGIFFWYQTGFLMIFFAFEF